jgi:hypothetical protein
LSGSTGISPNGSTAANTPVAFRKNFAPPFGKSPVQADILITVHESFTLYVNGGQVGTSNGNSGVAQRFCVALQPCLNVFAVTGVSGSANPPALLAVIQITYSDCTISTIVSDTTWRSYLTAPTGYEKLSYDANSWAPAIGAVPSAASWGPIAIPSASDPGLSLTSSKWIWTSEVKNGVAPPNQPRAFRQTYIPPTNQTAISVTIMAVADDSYSFYVNGKLVGSGTDYRVAQTYTLNLLPAAKVVFAVYAVNSPGGTVNNPAGLLVAVGIALTGSQCNCCPSSAYIVTDGSWKTFPGNSIVSFDKPSF